MKVILVNGSPHEKGCTYTALKEIEKSLNLNNIETELFWIGSEPISGCIGCNLCIESKRCFLKDKVNEFLDKVEETNGFIFGTPVHFAAMSGMLSSFMDRTFYGRRELFKNKPVAGIVCCRRAGSTNAYDEMNKYFAMSNMPIVTSQYWNLVYGTKPEEILEDKEGMQTMKTLGNNMAWMLKCIDSGKRLGIEEPKNEKVIKTNFIK